MNKTTKAKKILAWLNTEGEPIVAYTDIYRGIAFRAEGMENPYVISSNLGIIDGATKVAQAVLKRTYHKGCDAFLRRETGFTQEEVEANERMIGAIEQAVMDKESELIKNMTLSERIRAAESKFGIVILDAAEIENPDEV